MKNIFSIVCLLLFSTLTHAQEFKFAVISDLFVSPRSSAPMEDLKKVITDINEKAEVDFVLVLGNITEQGDKASMESVKSELGKLSMKYHVVSGNNETQRSESGGTAFKEVFGSERIDFQHEGYRFMGFASGPVVRTMDGHVDADDVFWLNSELSKAGNQPIIVATHYPLTISDVDNWYEVTDVLRHYNVKLVLSGHYGRNIKTTYDGIPALINRSTLKDKYDGLSAYNIYTIANGTISAAEQKVDPNLRPVSWGNYSLGTQYFTKDTKKFKRPSFADNNKYPKVNFVWSRNIFQTIYASPAYNGNKVFFGDDNGAFYAFEGSRDNQLWKYETGGRIVGTADANDRVVVFGSTDKTIYGLDVKNGNVLWQQMADAAVLGSATIDGNTVYIGASDGTFRALDVNTGNIKWQHLGVGDYIESKPFIFNDMVIFGAWDGKIYALNKNDGTLIWEWKNENEARQAAPGAVWPVAANGKVFFTTPDRYLTAVKVSNGDSIWRTNESMVSESIGLSEDKQRLFVKTVQDSVVCFSTLADQPQRLWTTNVGYGVDGAATMLVEKGGTVFGSTKNGFIFGLNSKNGELLWKFKVGNTHIGTVVPINGNRCVYATSQGNVGVLEGRK